MQDVVSLEGLALTVQIGFHPAELGVMQTVHVDLAVWCDFDEGPARDEFTGLVDYFVIAGHLARHVEGRAYSLIEAMAVDLAREVIGLYPAARVRVRVTKRPLGMPGVAVAAECVRSAQDLARGLASARGGG